MKDLVSKPEHASRSDGTKTGTETAVIVGGTVAAGVCLGITVFVCFAIYKQYLIHRKRRDSPANAQSKPQRPQTSDSFAFQSMRRFFNRRVSIADSASVYSCPSAAVDFEMARSSVAPTIPSKAASVLGVDRRTWDRQRPATKFTPVENGVSLPPSPRRESALAPIEEGSVSQSASYMAPSVGMTRAESKRRSQQASRQKARQSRQYSQTYPSGLESRNRSFSTCTMSTLGMELLRDTMRPPSPARFTPSQAPLPPTPSGTTGLKPKPSRRYFVPVFKQNGQLLSPTSPEGSLPMEMVMRDGSRARLFTSEENRI